MHVIRIVPLAALPNTVPQVLDYFWASALPEGALVRATIGHRSVTAVVLESMPLEHAKLAVKKAGFGLKKLTAVISETPQVTASQIALARGIARHYHAPLGICMKTVLPPFIGKRGSLLESAPAHRRSTRTAASLNLVLTQPDTALAHIRACIEKKPGQVLVIVPEIALARHLADHFSDSGAVVVHSDMGARRYRAAYHQARSGEARFFIGTRIGLFLPFSDLRHIIVEDPHHEAYKSDMTPRYNAPDIARQVCDITGASLTYLSPATSTVNAYAIGAGTLGFEDRKPAWPRIVHADMAAERQSGNRSLLSRPVQGAILDTYDDHRPLLIFSPRRAYATSVTCTRCHLPVLCATCAIPMRLHRTSEDMLVCYHCTAFTAVPKQCPSCRGGTLHPAGLAGSQKIAEAVRTCLDRHGLVKIPVPILDSDLVRSDAHEREVFERFDAMTQPVLVATQMIFSHRYTRSFDRIAVIEADALAYTPDFRAHERLAYQLEKLADFKPETMYIQSMDRSGALAYAETRGWDALHAKELAERKALGWPPFSRLVKLSYAHSDRNGAERAARTLAERLRRAAAHLGVARTVSILGPMPALLERVGGRWRHHIILKSTGTAQRLSGLLDHIPSGWTIDIDPRSIT